MQHVALEHAMTTRHALHNRAHRLFTLSLVCKLRVCGAHVLMQFLCSLWHIMHNLDMYV